MLVERPAGRPTELLAAPRADRVLLRHTGLVVRSQLLEIKYYYRSIFLKIPSVGTTKVLYLHGELDLALGALDGHFLQVFLLVLVIDELLGKVGDEVALHTLEPTPEVLQGRCSIEKNLDSAMATQIERIGLIMEGSMKNTN